MRSKTAIFVVTVVSGLAYAALQANQAIDPAVEKAAVYQAALDYVDAIYDADPSKIERSVHPTLTKLGLGPRGGRSSMTYDQLLATARTWNMNKNRDLSIKKVEVLDVLSQTAVAKVTALWGIDYMQLGKFDGQWKIVHIIWQSHPRTTAVQVPGF